MRTRKRAAGRLLLWLLLAPLAIAAFKALPAAGALREFLNLADAPHHLRTHLRALILMPLGALVVAVFRLTLGVRVFGLFRPVLLAMAFDVTGVWGGLVVLVLALAFMTALRPRLRAAYFARMSASLSLTATLLLVPALAALRLHAAAVDRLAYFPLIALCLTCESFAGILGRQGIYEAAWRTITTVACGMAIMALARVPGLVSTLMHHPELLPFLAGCILAVDRLLDFRLLDGRNPVRAAAGYWRRRAHGQVAAQIEFLKEECNVESSGG